MDDDATYLYYYHVACNNAALFSRKLVQSINFPANKKIPSKFAIKLKFHDIIFLPLRVNTIDNVDIKKNPKRHNGRHDFRISYGRKYIHCKLSKFMQPNLINLWIVCL